MFGELLFCLLTFEHNLILGSIIWEIYSNEIKKIECKMYFLFKLFLAYQHQDLVLHLHAYYDYYYCHYQGMYILSHNHLRNRMVS